MKIRVFRYGIEVGVGGNLLRIFWGRPNIPYVWRYYYGLQVYLRMMGMVIWVRRFNGRWRV